jgi:hypothetical protein
MRGKFIFGTLFGVVLVAVLFYFYGGSRAPSGQPPIENHRTKRWDIKTQFNLANDDVRVLLLLSDLNGMSAGGVCSREDYP